MSEHEQMRPAGAVEYVSSKPALLFGSDPRRRARAEGALQAAGVRLVGSLDIDEGLARLEEQASLGLAWIELGEEDATPETDRLLVKLNDLAETRGTLVFASTPLPLRP